MYYQLFDDTMCFSRLKTKINEPPKNKDDQAIPKSLERVIKLKDAVKAGKIVKRKRKRKAKTGLITLSGQNPRQHPNAKPEKAIPIFNQNPGETPELFMQRVNRETNLFLNETKFERQYNVEVKRNPETGDVIGIQKAPNDEIDELMRLKMKHKNIGKKKKKKTGDAEPKLTKTQKRKRKLEAKKEKKMQDNIDDFKGYRETVEFGEVVHAPPNLKLKPLISRNDVVPSKKQLLLNSLFPDSSKTKQGKTKLASIDKTGKRKDLPSAERRLLEQQQSDVVAAYRLLKARKSSDVNE